MPSLDFPLPKRTGCPVALELNYWLQTENKEWQGTECEHQNQAKAFSLQKGRTGVKEGDKELQGLFLELRQKTTEIAHETKFQFVSSTSYHPHPGLEADLCQRPTRIQKATR